MIQFVSLLGSLAVHPDGNKWMSAPGMCDTEMPKNTETVSSEAAGSAHSSSSGSSGGSLTVRLPCLKVVGCTDLPVLNLFAVGPICYLREVVEESNSLPACVSHACLCTFNAHASTPESISCVAANAAAHLAQFYLSTDSAVQHSASDVAVQHMHQYM